MRTATLVALWAAVTGPIGCVGKVRCYEASSTCSLTCDALPGEVFTGSITTTGHWYDGDPTSGPVSTIDKICQEGTGAFMEGMPCYSATPWQERSESIACDCKPWIVTDDDAPCPSFAGTWR